jgi:hypothetical protein
MQRIAQGCRDAGFQFDPCWLRVISVGPKQAAASTDVRFTPNSRRVSIIPGFKTVSLREIIVQPGSKTPENQVMMDAMVCHITEGELRLVQDGKPFTAKKTSSGLATKAQ